MMRFGFLMLICMSFAPSKAQSVIMECGQNSGNNFNGWYIHPHTVFDDVAFTDNSIIFTSDYGGYFTLSLYRKIETMANYKSLNVLFNFETSRASELLEVTYYLSVDGKHWDPFQQSRNNASADMQNDSLGYQYVKAEAHVNMSNDGQVICDYAKVMGTALFPQQSLAITNNEIEKETTDFHIFNYQHDLNIETQSNESYEVMLTGLDGKIVLRKTYLGSNRITLPSHLSGFFIVTVIQHNAFKVTKKIQL